jgi:hypothetical protein
MVTTHSEIGRYAALSQNKTAAGMIEATIYHIRHEGVNVVDRDEKSKYYSDAFLKNQRQVNDKVEEELEEFKAEIDDKLKANETRGYVFPRPYGKRIHVEGLDNKIAP